MKFPAALTRIAAALRPKAMSAVPTMGGGGWYGLIRESFAGAFQANINIDPPVTLLAYSPVFSPVTLIASDISKLCLELSIEDNNGVCTPAPATSPYWQVLRKPNHFQNRIQFIESWVLSKLLWGNSYAIKERDARRIVTALYVLDPQRVTPLVATNGDVYYKLEGDALSGLPSSITVPATEIIHDRWNCLWHPLVGISPLYSAGMSATVGSKIQANSARFFQNMSRPSGMLTSPSTIPDETALRLKTEWENNYGGSNFGRVAIAGSGLEYKPMAIPADAAQLVEQLNWTAVDIARAFHMPLFKVAAESGRNAGTLSVEAQQQQYLNDCLQVLIESIELCLTDGLAVPPNYSVEIDEDGLLRMDKAAQADALSKQVGAGIMAPNEARAKLGLPPVPGGDTPYLQQQYWGLAQLAKRTAAPDGMPIGSSPAPAPVPEPEKQFDVLGFVKALEAAELETA